MHQPTKGKPVPFAFIFLFKRYDRHNDPKKYESDHYLSEQKKNGAGFPFVCTCGSDTRLFSDRNIERGIAVMPPVLITIYVF